MWNVGLPVVLVGLSDRNIFSDDFTEAMMSSWGGERHGRILLEQ